MFLSFLGLLLGGELPKRASDRVPTDDEPRGGAGFLLLRDWERALDPGGPFAPAPRERLARGGVGPSAALRAAGDPLLALLALRRVATGGGGGEAAVASSPRVGELAAVVSVRLAPLAAASGAVGGRRGGGRGGGTEADDIALAALTASGSTKSGW